MEIFATILAWACIVIFTPVFICRVSRRGKLALLLKDPRVRERLAVQHRLTEVKLPEFPKVSGVISLLSWCWVIAQWM